MRKYSVDVHMVHHSVRLVVTLFVLLGFLIQNIAGSAYYSLLMEPNTTVTTPSVTLQNGTAGTSTIYTNNTSAKVSVTATQANNTEDYVDITSNVDNSTDIGTHSNFTAQQHGPDSIYDTLTEEKTHTLELWVDGFTADEVLWVEVGAAPYLNAVDYATNYIWAIPTDNEYESKFDFSNSSNLGTINDVKICLYAMDAAGGNDEIEVYLYNSTGGPYSIAQFAPTAGSWGWYNYSCLSTIPTWTEVNNGQLRVRAEKILGSDSVYIDAALLLVNYTNCEMDLEVQWTNVDFDETSEELAIYADIQNNTYSLDATGGYMIVGNGTVDWGSTEGTISFWVKMDGSVQGRFWGQDNNMETRWSGTNLLLDWGGTGSMTSAYSFSADTWYFVAIVWDEINDDLLLYIGDRNNPPSLDANSLSGTWTSTTPSATENRFLNGLGGDEPVDGHGDELRYWNVARNLTQLQSDYNVELTGSESNLRSYFKLNGNFDDVGPDNDDGSGYDGYSFSSDVPFFQLTENIQVDVWNGSTWQNIFNNLTNGWNNKTVSSYLTSSNFTIRFTGSNETNDTTQESWDIDATILHTLTFVETTYDYVLRVNNTVTDSWQIRLKKYSDSNIGRLQNCTTYFHNSSDGTSRQIYIQNGLYTNQTGPWYDLGSSETIYIAMTVDANSTGTSYVYTYLEILTLVTTTYARYIIAFEIT